MFTLNEGVSEPWTAAIFVSTVSKNTQILCITHPFVIYPKHNKNPHLNIDICELMHYVLCVFFQ